MEQNDTIGWDILEYEEKNRSIDWYWGVGIATITIVALAFIFGDILFGILILIAVCSLAYLTIRKPEMVHVEIGQKGIKAGDELYPYHNLLSFWIEREETHPNDRHLLLMSKRKLMPLITIPLPLEFDENILRNKLLENLEEQELQDSRLHKFVEILGF
jgi:hypothetical protein